MSGSSGKGAEMVLESGVVLLALTLALPLRLPLPLPVPPFLTRCSRPSVTPRRRVTPNSIPARVGLGISLSLALALAPSSNPRPSPNLGPHPYPNPSQVHNHNSSRFGKWCALQLTRP